MACAANRLHVVEEQPGGRLLLDRNDVMGADVVIAPVKSCPEKFFRLFSRLV